MLQCFMNAIGIEQATSIPYVAQQGKKAISIQTTTL